MFTRCVVFGRVSILEREQFKISIKKKKRETAQFIPKKNLTITNQFISDNYKLHPHENIEANAWQYSSLLDERKM